jgi:hypothetical protein
MSIVNDVRRASQGPVVEPAARTLRRRLLSDEMIDGLLGEVDAGGLRLTGEGWVPARAAESRSRAGFGGRARGAPRV